MDDALLREIKNYLDITWDEDSTDRKIMGFIREGIDYLEHRAGEPLDFFVQPDAMSLLKDYVRYARDAALDVFETNNLSRILDMQNRRKMSRAQSSIPAGQYNITDL